MAERCDVAVIGAGPGGARAARRCAQRGASVALIEKEYIGGTCLNWGCIPAKTLLASAHTLLSAKRAAEIGVDIASATPNWAKIQARKDAIVTGFRKAMIATAQANKIKLIQGAATVVSATQIKVKTDAGQVDIEADKIILATGSEPIQLPALPFDGETIIGSKEALSLPQVPPSLVIVGGGVIGCEMACVYAAMGTKVTIIEALARLVPMEDEWVGRLLEREFKKLGIQALTGQRVTSADKTTTPAKITLENAQTLNAEKVLVCVGRRPLVDKDAVGALDLQMNKAAVSVNEKLQTNVPGVYAIGDLIGTTFLAHGATTEAEVAAANATGGDRKMSDYSLIPRVIFTFPEVASVGKSEGTCKSEGLDISVGKGFFKANGRSVAHNDTVGQIRLVRDNSTNKILGVTMVGSMATEYAAFAATITGRTRQELGHITFPHPTFSETLEDALEDAFGPT
jgi:dihydrolipoamide dehydrogenase